MLLVKWSWRFAAERGAFWNDRVKSGEQEKKGGGGGGGLVLVFFQSERGIWLGVVEDS